MGAGLRPRWAGREVAKGGPIPRTQWVPPHPPIPKAGREREGVGEGGVKAGLSS